jgi:hypothetical protein
MPLSGRIAMIGVVVCVCLFLAPQVEAKDDTVGDRAFQEIPDVAPLMETELVEVTGSSRAQAFAECDYQGKAREVGTPIVINGHNGVRSLKVPSGECVSLFNKEGYNDDEEGQMLEVRGPVNIHCLDKVALKGGKGNWLTDTRSYKMGRCAPQESVQLATSAVKAAAVSASDLHALSAKAVEAATGQFGSVVVSYTHPSHLNDGIAYPYEQHKLAKADLEVMQTGMQVKEIVTTTGDEASATTVPPASYEGSTESPASESATDVNPDDALKAMKAFEDGSDTTPAPTSDAAFTPPGGWHSTSAHAALKIANAEYKQAKAEAGSNTSPLESEPERPVWHGNATEHFKNSHLKINMPFPASPAPDDPEDMLRRDQRANFNATGHDCDPDLGCGEQPKLCVDKNSAELCAEFKAKGSCTFDYAERDCQKTCALCPPDEGSIYSDQSIGPMGHLYLGKSRRRIGAGFGRRRAALPTPEEIEEAKLKASAKYKSGMYDIKKVVETVPETPLNPDGKKATFELVPKPEDEAKVEAATEKAATLPEPINHPNAAAKAEASSDTAAAVSDVPPAVEETASHTSEAGSATTAHEELESAATSGNPFAAAAIAEGSAESAAAVLAKTKGSAEATTIASTAEAEEATRQANAEQWAANTLSKEEGTVPSSEAGSAETPTEASAYANYMASHEAAAPSATTPTPAPAPRDCTSQEVKGQDLYIWNPDPNYPDQKQNPDWDKGVGGCYHIVAGGNLLRSHDREESNCNANGFRRDLVFGTATTATQAGSSNLYTNGDTRQCPRISPFSYAMKARSTWLYFKSNPAATKSTMVVSGTTSCDVRMVVTVAKCAP